MQRRRLSLAIVEVLSEDGFENASVGRICKRAGVSRRTFYELFEGREECLLAALDAVVARISPAVLAAYEAGESWRERIRNALTTLLELLDAEPDMARVCVVETLKAGPAVAEWRAGVIGALVLAVEEGRSESRPRDEPPPLIGQGVVGGALSVIHAHLLADTGSERGKSNGRERSLSALNGALMAMIVHPYLGSVAARREIDRLSSKTQGAAGGVGVKDPFKGLSIRFTYRTARVLSTIASDPGASNRLIADTSGIVDEGQMSRLLTRLQRSGLIENRGEGQAKGEPNAWLLTERGTAVHAALGVRA
jgi:AcrR family transcriptional regulator/DNA-binding MarR family transcriptional regulator